MEQKSLSLDALADLRNGSTYLYRDKLLKKYEAQVASIQYYLSTGERMPEHDYKNLNQKAVFCDGGLETLIAETIKECLNIKHMSRRELSATIGSKLATTQTYIDAVKIAIVDLADGVMHVPPQFIHLVESKNVLEQEFERIESKSNSYIPKEQADAMVEEVKTELEAKLIKFMELMNMQMDTMKLSYENKISLLTTDCENAVNKANTHLMTLRVQPALETVRIPDGLPAITAHSALKLPPEVEEFVGMVLSKNSPKFSRILIFIVTAYLQNHEVDTINLCGIHGHEFRKCAIITTELMDLIVKETKNRGSVTNFQCKNSHGMRYHTFKTYVKTYGEVIRFLNDNLSLYRAYLREAVRRG